MLSWAFTFTYYAIATKLLGNSDKTRAEHAETTDIRQDECGTDPDSVVRIRMNSKINGDLQVDRYIYIYWKIFTKILSVFPKIWAILWKMSISNC